jgi:hypothetical protein
MRNCTSCGSPFPPTGKGYRCPPCRKAYDAAWRQRRREQDMPASGTSTWAPEKKRAWQAAYYARKDVRQRKAAQMRQYAQAHNTREHHRARWQVRRAVAAGALTRQPCEVCGAIKVDAHHDDYAQPLNVRWLCRPHHVEHHAKAEGR